MAEIEHDPLVDLWPEVAIGRIERIVEVEDPGVDVRESACGRQGCGTWGALAKT